MTVTWAKLVRVMGREIRGKINRAWCVCALITFKLPQCRFDGSLKVACPLVHERAGHS